LRIPERSQTTGWWPGCWCSWNAVVLFIGVAVQNGERFAFLRVQLQQLAEIRVVINGFSHHVNVLCLYP
jgi:hypothetical protein